MLALALFVASCSSGDDSSDTQSESGSGQQSSGSGSQGGTSASTAGFVPTGALVAVDEYLESQGERYVGDCADAVLPRDEGAWCSTVVEDGDEQKVYEVGPVGEEPELRVTVDRRGSETLTPGFQVEVLSGNVGIPRELTTEEIQNNVFITGNIALDQALGLSPGLTELPPGAPTTTTDTGTGGTGTGGTGTGGTGTGGTGTGGTGGGTVTVEPGNAQYPPEGEIVIDDPDVEPGGTVVFQGGGCLPNEPLDIFFDGRPVGTLVADANGDFAGSLNVPVGTRPGSHLLTVKGSVCELNATVTVLGDLAFTGSSNSTSTTVLVGVAAVVLGLVLVVGTRRRRTSAGSRAGP